VKLWFVCDVVVLWFQSEDLEILCNMARVGISKKRWCGVMCEKE